MGEESRGGSAVRPLHRCSALPMPPSAIRRSRISTSSRPCVPPATRWRWRVGQGVGTL